MDQKFSALKLWSKPLSTLSLFFISSLILAGLFLGHGTRNTVLAAVCASPNSCLSSCDHGTATGTCSGDKECCKPCTPGTWGPPTSGTCTTNTLVQTDNACGTTRTVSGTKICPTPTPAESGNYCTSNSICVAEFGTGSTCNTSTHKCSTPPCVVSSWTPDTQATTCTTDSIDQTSNCGTKRTVYGKKDCSGTPCNNSCDCAKNICAGKTCTNACGKTCTGTNDCTGGCSGKAEGASCPGGTCKKNASGDIVCKIEDVGGCFDQTPNGNCSSTEGCSCSSTTDLSTCKCGATGGQAPCYHTICPAGYTCSGSGTDSFCTGGGGGNEITCGTTTCNSTTEHCCPGSKCKAKGTACGGSGCTDSTWTPNPTDTCNTTTVNQTSNCGTKRTVPGTKVCSVVGACTELKIYKKNADGSFGTTSLTPAELAGLKINDTIQLASKASIGSLKSQFKVTIDDVVETPLWRAGTGYKDTEKLISVYEYKITKAGKYKFDAQVSSKP